MSGLLSNIVQNLLEWLLGEGIESAGDLRANRWVRGAAVTLLFLLSAGIAVASALFWTSQRHHGISGLWQWVQSGGPAWVLAAPVFAALTFLLLLVPGPGKFTPIAFSATAAFGFTLAALAAFQGGGTSVLDASAFASGAASIVLPLIALMLAMGDVPPLDAPLARVAMTYWGRRRHLLALRAWGKQRGWRITEPSGANNALILQGNYDPTHPVTATSSATIRMSQSNSFGYALSVKIGSPYDIVAFRISADPPPTKARARVAAGKLRVGLGRTIHYYVVPLPTHPLPDGFMERLAAVVDASRPRFGKLDFAHATPFGLRYTHKAGRSLTPRDADLEPLLGWMYTLCTLLEEVSLRPASNAAPDDSAPGAPPSVYA